jgi:hypothetical protein
MAASLLVVVLARTTKQILKNKLKILKLPSLNNVFRLGWQGL